MNIIVLPDGLYYLTCAPSPAVNTESRAADRWMICASVTVSCLGSRFPTSPIAHTFFVPTTRINLFKMRLPYESSKLVGRKFVFTCTPNSGRYKSATRLERPKSVRVFCTAAESSSPFAFVVCTSFTCILYINFKPSFCSSLHSLDDARQTMGRPAERALRQ